MGYVELITLDYFNQTTYRLNKFYTNNTKKYRGEVYNILNIKLQVFYNYCIIVKVLEE